MSAATARVVAGSLYVGVCTALAAVAAWPIYRSGAFLVLVAVAVAVAAGIAAIATARRWGGWAVSGMLAAAVLLLGVPLAVPARVGGPLELLRGELELAGGLVFGWKDLLTVELPVGSYRNLLVPALVVFLVGTCAAAMLAWRRGRVAVGAVPVTVTMACFGLLFGRTSVSDTLVWGPVRIDAPVETVVGLGTLLAGVLWLSWRARERRRGVLRASARASGVRLRRAPGGVWSRRGLYGLGMVLVAVLAAAAVVPAAAGSERTVLRGTTGPDVEVTRAVSPLSGYRVLFADDFVDEVWFTVDGADLPDRVRLAVLDEYDGVSYRTGSGDRFDRVPSSVPARDGAEVEATVVVGRMTGIWMPIIGSLQSATFDGSRAATLSDRFYFSRGLDAAVQIAPWAEGDRYVVRATVPAVPKLSEIVAPGVVPDVEIPQGLSNWVDEHREGDGGEALARLVELLRERGYLSHGLDETSQLWQRDLDGAPFVPSTAGHSVGRVDAMFEALLTREADPRAAESGNYVAAVGDDEQFAVAASLIAQQLGFPARIVVGARLSSGEGLPVCEDGRCRAGDLAAWLEVRAASGEWVAVDVSPQHEVVPSLEVTQRREPRVPTEVDPDTIEEVTPPRPSQNDTVREPTPDAAADLAWLWPAVRVAGIVGGVLLLVAGPFLAVVALKALRRRRRRRAPGAGDAITGGWREYVDAAVDAGRGAPGRRTRAETAELYASARAFSLAAEADRADYSGHPSTASQAAEYWRVVDSERRRFTPGFWTRVRSAVSLRSFARLGALTRVPHRTSGGGEPLIRGSRRMT
ncbi:transglutaminase domain-containing protein [Microbacterium sp.]|uniref:transglutaminase domain-containing protein n=1 Tax=Microbacterium sp. TaxID=51671 RepID=UPI003A87820D